MKTQTPPPQLPHSGPLGDPAIIELTRISSMCRIKFRPSKVKSKVSCFKDIVKSLSKPILKKSHYDAVEKDSPMLADICNMKETKVIHCLNRFQPKDLIVVY